MSYATQARRGPGLLGLLGRACYRHRWITLIVWLAGVACLITLWTRFGAPAQNSFNGSDPGQSLLNRHFPHASGTASPWPSTPPPRSAPRPSAPGWRRRSSRLRVPRT